MTPEPGGPHERPRWRPRPRGRRLRRLQARLLLWFLGAIVLAIGASVLTTVLTASDNESADARRLASTCSTASRAPGTIPSPPTRYVAELRETTGLDMRVRRDPSLFRRPAGARRRTG